MRNAIALAGADAAKRRPALLNGFRAFFLLFAAAVVTLAGLAAPAAADGYRLRSGDVLRVEVLEDPGLNRSALVAPDGRVTLPMAGSIPAGGRTVEQIQADLTQRLAPSFAAAPTVYVSLDRLAEPRAAAAAAAPATIGIFVVGEAAKTGRLEVAPDTNVLQAFAIMGGFTKFAAKKRIQLRRDGKTYPLNYNQIEAGTSTAGNTQLQAGDVIVVPQRGLFE